MHMPGGAWWLLTVLLLAGSGCSEVLDPDVLDVRLLAEPPLLTTPAYVKGVINLRGRIIRVTRQFAAHAGPVTLSQGTEYDAQDRILRDIFPDGSTLEHDYSPRGLERPLEHFIERADYDALARWRELELPSGVTLRRDLDHGGRVLGQRVTAGSRTLLGLAHRYDVAGQLAETDDDLAAEGFSLSQTFVYDDLRRLVGHTASGKTQTRPILPVAPFTKSRAVPTGQASSQARR